MHGLPWNQRVPTRPDSKRYGNLVFDRSIGEIQSGIRGNGKPFGIPHGCRRKRYKAISSWLTWPIGLPGKIPFPPFNRDLKERNSMTKDAASCHGANGRAIVCGPSLQRLRWYFLEQMRKFRAGSGVSSFGLKPWPPYPRSFDRARRGVLRGDLWPEGSSIATVRTPNFGQPFEHSRRLGERFNLSGVLVVPTAVVQIDSVRCNIVLTAGRWRIFPAAPQNPGVTQRC